MRLVGIVSGICLVVTGCFEFLALINVYMVILHFLSLAAGLVDNSFMVRPICRFGLDSS